MPTEHISPKKQKLIDEMNNSPVVAGETVYVKRKILTPNSFTRDPDRTEQCVVLSVDGDKITVMEGDGSVNRQKVQVGRKDIHKAIIDIGANPFSKDADHARTVAFTLQSVLFTLDALGEKYAEKKESSRSINGVDTKFQAHGIDVEECNWNPFVYDKSGKKTYYQRPFVWTTKDKQNLIDSIYQRIDCGRILIRRRSFLEIEKMAKSGEKELAFHDIVDGKQRLNAVVEFIQGKFKDSYGNYFSDLSYRAQMDLTNHQLFGYSELPDNSPDEIVIQQFLKLNFCGVPQSTEHIEFVKSIMKKM